MRTYLHKEIAGNKIDAVALLLLVLLIFNGCTPPKKLRYLQGETDVVHPVKREFTYNIQPGDVLYIKINTLDNETHQSFNIQGEVASRSSSEIALYLNSYTVSDSGMISFPICGDIYLAGQSIEEAAKTIQKEVAVYLKETTVLVKLMSFKVTILGDVNNPGVYQVYDASLNLFEALGLAGDLNNFGKRKTIKLIRQVEGGLKIVEIDITNQDVLSSEYFYLLPNDILYVEPHVAKSFGFEKFPFTEIFTSISTLIVILTFINAK
jgi:polysaccharide export outer membrane protein